jgi:hypothetical protein
MSENKNKLTPYQSIDGRCCHCNILLAFQSVETMLGGVMAGPQNVLDGIGSMYIEIAPPTTCAIPNKIFKIR